MISERRKRRKTRLFEMQGGLCYYCKKPMLLSFEHYKHSPKNLATFEHLDSRLSSERGKHQGERRVVLACWECNNNQAREVEKKLLPISELRERSKRGRPEQVARSTFGAAWY